MLTILFLFGFYSYAETNQDINCLSAHFDEKVRIKYIIDGDTVVLDDKRHIRLIGINTPEISHDNKTPSEQGANAAKTALTQLLDKQTSVRLLYGKGRQDKYGRTLAHLFLNSGINVQAEMLKRGFALPLRVPPNLFLAKCYDKASLLAKKEKRGLWVLTRYKTHNVASLSGSEKGFYIIAGKVNQITKSRSSIWINLTNVALRIDKDDLRYFNSYDLMSLQGKVIEASGWLYKHKKRLRMRIRHKLDLKY